MAQVQGVTKTGTLKTVFVTEDGELIVRAITESEIEHASGEGKAFSWDSGELDIDAGDTMLFVQRTGDVPLIIDRVEISGSNVICTWEINVGTASTTATGTGVSAVSLNTSFTAEADATAFSDETAVADGNTVARVKTAVSGHETVDMVGVILGKNHYIQINQETESTSGSVIVHGHFLPVA